MKLQKRKLKVAGIFGVCWVGVMVGVVDGVVGFGQFTQLSFIVHFFDDFSIAMHGDLNMIALTPFV